MLAEALRTVARQTHLELELILVRDGGEALNEEARAELDRLEFPSRVLEHEDPPHGLARSRNLGIEAARADAIAFLDDDDLWDVEHVKRLSAHLDRDFEADVVYSDARIHRDPDGERVLAQRFDVGVFRRDSFIPPSAFAARRSAFERHGLFDTEIPYSEDWEWLLRVLKDGGKIVRAPGVTATIRIHSGGLSQLTPERSADRKRSLDTIASRYKLAPLVPKTFWEVAGDLCPDPNATTR
jgi:glycosyltransferase involved in cell wall biosynthesis